LYYIPSGQAASAFFKQLSADQLIYMPAADDSVGGVDSDEETDKGTIQKILYGCPGTGKSFKVKKRTEGLDGKKAIYFGKDEKRIEMPEDETERIKTPSNIFRTTFHPDYDYATFVGTYKPLMKRPKGSEDDESVKEELSYDFVPQVFTNAYVRAWKSWEDETLEGKDKNVFLIIEEINRGNCAQIFGDLFQLLDRKEGFSEFPIIPDAELSKYLKDKKVPYDSLRLPPNFHIYATMNTSDQSLFPMDSAFKRRWSMEYVPIKYKDTDAEDYKLNLYKTEFGWTEFLRLVNAKILDATNSEDKQMGEFFIKGDISEEDFKNKVMFYLWNDVCKDLYSASRISPLYFMRSDDAEGNKNVFTFAELYGKGRYEDDTKDYTAPVDLLEGFITKKLGLTHLPAQNQE
jgi:5-methylcytosine-specific restriction endonuclease McrBC GTP-binding regulatory subunit McrB